MKKVVAYLQGTYPKKDLPFYTSLTRGRTTIAVDGGYRFFKAAGLMPDFLIGDFDSVPRLPRDIAEQTTVMEFPPAKDMTDAHLAVDYCLREGATDIDIVMPGYGDIDHALGSVLLLGLGQLKSTESGGPKIRVINPAYEIRLVADASTTFRNCKGDRLSVLPLSASIRLSLTGTAYNVKNVKIRIGETRGLRNEITAARATVTISGRALVVHLFG